MEFSETLAPKSKQQDYEDYIAGPRTVTISAVTIPGGDQPVHIELVEFPGRPFKPSKTVRRILAYAWGPNSEKYVGRRMTLYGDPTVTWGGEVVGGIRVSHLSDIDKPISIALAESSHKRKRHTVQPLPATTAPAPSTRDWLAELKLADGNHDAIGALGKAATDAHAPKEIVAAIRTAFEGAAK